MRVLGRNIPGAILLAGAFVAGAIVGRVNLRATEPPATPTPAVTAGGLPSALDAARVREVWDALHERFAGALDDADLATGALRGIAAGSGDPYTSYADAEESKQFEDDLSGSFTGVGIEIGLRRGAITVIAPLRGSPAERAGIRARDIIVNINGEEINNHLTLTEVVSKIRGPAGSDVRLSVAREGKDDLLDFTVRRERISLESLKLELRDRIAIVTLSNFTEDVDQTFRAIARRIVAGGAKAVLLDLRNNPGGLLDTSVKVAAHFLPKDTLVVSEVPKAGTARTEHRTEGPADLAHLPVVVLINGGSASASEILAAALHEQRDAPLVGEQTFGKGSVQELVELSDGATLRVTIAKWHTPRDREIGEDGIKPTVQVDDPDPAADPDEILEKGLEILRQQVSK